jgi:hypothetical protein
MQGFVGHIIASSHGYAELGYKICQLITFASQNLSGPFPNDMTAQQSREFHWTQLISEFWDEVQPRGYLFLNHEDQHVKTVVELVYKFALCLSLQLQDPDMSQTPPMIQNKTPISAPQLFVPYAGTDTIQDVLTMGSAAAVEINQPSGAMLDASIFTSQTQHSRTHQPSHNIRTQTHFLHRVLFLNHKSGAHPATSVALHTQRRKCPLAPTSSRRSSALNSARILR